jgi:endonuclease/exonuclease/phosphatase family metal-dependent hydrolase
MRVFGTGRLLELPMFQNRMHVGVGMLALLAVAGTASAQLRVVTWNISNYTGGRTVDIQTVVYATAPNGLRMAPDVICLQEVTSNSALQSFLSALNTAPGSPADWAAAPFPVAVLPQVSLPDTQGVMLYRTSKVQFLGNRTIALGGGDLTNQPRNTYRHDIRPFGYNAVGTSIGIYNTHLKAAAAAADEARRLVEAVRIRDNIEGIATNGVGSGLPAGYNFIVLGDFNIQTSTDDSYVEFTGSQANNAGRLFDPIARPGSWNSSNTFRFIHTQDPSGSGGMDDRFDFLLLSAGLIDGTGLDYIGNPASPYSSTTWDDPNHSYRAWGNDGTSCCNSPMNTVNNSMVGNVIAQSIINCATAAGGHIPVFLDLRVPAKVGASVASIDFGNVNQNAVASRSITVSNAGDVARWTTAGIASLAYTLAASAGFTAPGGSFNDAATAGGLSHAITMNTATLGPKNGTITINSNDPDVPALVISVTGNVVSANQPPVANAGPDQTVTDTDGDGFQSVTLNGSGSTDPQGNGTITEYRWLDGATTISASSSPTITTLFAVGSRVITLRVTDSGGLFSTDTVNITVNPGCVADVDDGTGTGTPDGGVGVEDLLYYLSLYDAGSPGADTDDGTGTGTRDGGVGIEDLLYYLTRFDAGC